MEQVTAFLGLSLFICPLGSFWEPLLHSQGPQEAMYKEGPYRSPPPQYAGGALMGEGSLSLTQAPRGEEKLRPPPLDWPRTHDLPGNL